MQEIINYDRMHSRFLNKYYTPFDLSLQWLLQSRDTTYEFNDEIAKIYHIEKYLRYRYDMITKSFNPFVDENLATNGYMIALNLH